MRQLITAALAASTVVGAVAVSAVPAAAHPWGWHRPYYHYGDWRRPYPYWGPRPVYYVPPPYYGYGPVIYGPRFYHRGWYGPRWHRW